MAKLVKIMMVMTCFVSLTVAFSFAQESYPNKPVQVIVSYAAGGSLDLVSRILAEKLREQLGQPVLVVNKPGATGGIAIGYVATSKPDGYNLYSAAGVALGYLRLINPSFTYGPSDFSAIAGFAKFPQVIVVSKDLPIKNIAELVAYAKKNPGTLSYSTPGYAGSSNLSFELFKLSADIPQGNIQHVPYTGVAPALTALVGNQVQLGCLPFSALIVKQIEAGAIRGLAVLSPKRFPFRPDIPTIVEEGYPDPVTLEYYSLWAPAKTPGPIVKKLEEAVRRATENREVREKVESMYHEVEFLSSQDLGKYMETESSKWGAVIKKLNIVIK